MGRQVTFLWLVKGSIGHGPGKGAQECNITHGPFVDRQVMFLWVLSMASVFRDESINGGSG